MPQRTHIQVRRLILIWAGLIAFGIVSFGAGLWMGRAAYEKSIEPAAILGQ